MLNITTKNSRKTYFGIGEQDFEEKPMFGLVCDSEMLHLYLFWRHFYWVFPRKLPITKVDIFVIGKKVIITNTSKIGKN